MWSRPPGERLTLILPFWWLSPFALEVSGRVLAGDEQEPVHQDYHLILSRKTKAGLDQRNRNLVPHLGLKRSHHRFEPAFSHLSSRSAKSHLQGYEDKRGQEMFSLREPK